MQQEAQIFINAAWQLHELYISLPSNAEQILLGADTVRSIRQKLPEDEQIMTTLRDAYSTMLTSTCIVRRNEFPEETDWLILELRSIEEIMRNSVKGDLEAFEKPRVIPPRVRYVLQFLQVMGMEFGHQ